MKKKIMLLLTAAAFNTNAQQPCFETNGFVSGSNPNQVVSADFTGDGILDIASTSIIFEGENGSVKISVGTGDGTFVVQEQDFEVELVPSFLVAGDFNEDGMMDIAVNNRASGSMSILLAEGGGSFLEAVSYTVNSVSTNTKGLAMGDFNHDGNIDLVMGNNDEVAVFFGAGDGTFGLPYFLEVEPGSDICFVAAGDVNNDGNDDVVTVNIFLETISMLMGDGEGGFGAPIDLETGIMPASVTIANIDGNGFNDLIIPTYGANNIAVYRGIGGDNFSGPVIYPTNTPSSSVVSDFNGDGVLDIVAVNREPSSSITAFLGIGNGTFQQGVAFNFGELYANTAITGDFDNDGDQDIITSNVNDGNNGKKNISVFLNCMPLGTESFSLGSMTFYPNPAANLIQVQMSNNIEVISATFYNTLGQVVMQAGNETSWNVSGLSSGLHFVTLQTSEGTAQLKFIRE